MKKILLALIAASLCAAPAFADSITGGSTTGSSITTGPVTSSNSGSVTATGNFGHVAIHGGKNNFIGVTSTGAAVLIQITKNGGDPNAATNDSIGVGSINASNTGTVTATGHFQGAISNMQSQSTSSGNSIGVSAAGTSVTISVSHQ